MDQYEFCARTVAALLPASGAILDFGCGTGVLLDRFERLGLNARGCDIIENGWHYTGPTYGLRHHMTDGLIPFADETFDVVASNQVLEHCPDLDLTLNEIARVLKPGGKFFAAFPDVHVWREVHTGIPFLHWMRSGGIRSLYVRSMIRAGIASPTDEKTLPARERALCARLDNDCYYRTQAEMDRAFASRFRSIKHIEDEWVAQRMPALTAFPSALRTLIARRMAGVAVVCEK